MAGACTLLGVFYAYSVASNWVYCACMYACMLVQSVGGAHILLGAPTPHSATCNSFTWSHCACMHGWGTCESLDRLGLLWACMLRASVRVWATLVYCACMLGALWKVWINLVYCGHADGICESLGHLGLSCMHAGVICEILDQECQE